MLCKECDYYLAETSCCMLNGLLVNGETIECDDSRNAYWIIEKN